MPEIKAGKGTNIRESGTDILVDAKLTAGPGITVTDAVDGEAVEVKADLTAGDSLRIVEDEDVLTIHAKQIIGPASNTDANGNPTPDPAVYDPAAYQGYIFKAVSYPAAVDGGSMEFVSEETTPGVWEWVWRWGSFRASNSNGNYVRSADGWQTCEGEKEFASLSITVQIGSTGIYRNGSTSALVTLPAAFSSALWTFDAQEGHRTAAYAPGGFGVVQAGSAGSTSQGYILFSREGSGTSTVTAQWTAEGRWKA